MSYWYISFATETEFLGGTVVSATSAKNALAAATLRGLNPGGEAAILALPPGAEEEPDRRAMTNRLVGRAEMMARGATKLDDLPHDTRRAVEKASKLVCEECNPVRN